MSSLLSIHRVYKNWEFFDETQRIMNQIIQTRSWETNFVGSGRRFISHVKDFDLLRKEAFSTFNLVPFSDEPLFGNFIGNHCIDGAFVHPHKDPPDDKLVHTRVNVMIKKPVSGGMPVLDDVEYEVDEGDIWLCIAGRELHYSTPAIGERLTVSFGALISKEMIDKITYQF